MEGPDAEVLEVEMAELRTAAVMEALASVYDPCCQEKGRQDQVSLRFIAVEFHGYDLVRP